jgi:DNA helicase-2/ATP-dependent DNA helicase PcrA
MRSVLGYYENTPIALAYSRRSRFDVPKAAAEDWPAFAKLFARIRRAKAGWPAEFELVRRWYESHLQRIYDDAHLRAADIAQLEQIAASYGSRERFLTELTLDPPQCNERSRPSEYAR